MGGGNSKASAAVRVTQVYELQEILGKGSFASVYEAKLLEEGRVTAAGLAIPNYVAIKAIDKSKLPDDEIPLLQEECTIMNKLQHPNCVGLLEFFDEPDFFYLVLELVRGGELFDQIVSKGFFNEVEAAHATKQIAQSLAYLESMKIVHRDVKPENLIYESNALDANIKLTDFGLAKDISEMPSEFPLTDPCGTPGYVAPEILQGMPYGGKVDTWALGVILFILLCGYPPFYAEEQPELFEQIKKGQYRFDSPYWDEVSEPAKDVVRKLLQIDPVKRISATQLLEEPWVANPEEQNSTNFGDHVLEGIDKIRKMKLQRAIFKIRAMNGFGALAKAARGFDTAKASATASEKSKQEESKGEDSTNAGSKPPKSDESDGDQADESANVNKADETKEATPDKEQNENADGAEEAAGLVVK